MKLKHFFLAFSLLYSFLALAIGTNDQETESDLENVETETVAAAPAENNESITSRLKEEMNYLHQSVEGIQPKPQTVQKNNTTANNTTTTPTNNRMTSLDDLEEKINYRSAAVKKADNHESELNVDELDSENFE